MLLVLIYALLLEKQPLGQLERLEKLLLEQPEQPEQLEQLEQLGLLVLLEVAQFRDVHIPSVSLTNKIGGYIWQNGRSESLWISAHGNCTTKCSSFKSNVTCVNGVVDGNPSAAAYWGSCSDGCPSGINAGTLE